MNDLEKKVLEIIEKRYKKKYIGGIKVTRLSSGGYSLKLDFCNQDAGNLVISSDLNDQEDFLLFIEKELVSRQLIKTEWFKGIKIYPDEKRGTC